MFICCCWCIIIIGDAGAAALPPTFILCTTGSNGDTPLLSAIMLFRACDALCSSLKLLEKLLAVFTLCRGRLCPSAALRRLWRSRVIFVQEKLSSVWLLWLVVFHLRRMLLVRIPIVIRVLMIELLLLLLLMLLLLLLLVVIHVQIRLSESIVIQTPNNISYYAYSTLREHGRSAFSTTISSSTTVAPSFDSFEVDSGSPATLLPLLLCPARMSGEVW
uniref:Secreted peptide n=1 Tax=Anopheles culicifacies TaxID=139723 RepID=A0A182M936_9DIPT